MPKQFFFDFLESQIFFQAATQRRSLVNAKDVKLRAIIDIQKAMAMINYIIMKSRPNNQDESHKLFTIQQLPESIQHKITPIAQLLNLEIIDIDQLKVHIAGGIPEESGCIRQYAWKLVLGFLPKDRKRWQSHLHQQEQLYQSFLEQFLSKQKYQEAPVAVNKSDPNWKDYEKDYHLWDQIEKDTCRTQAQLSFFSAEAEAFPIPFYTSTRREKYKLISGDEQLIHLTRQQQKRTYNYDYMTRILFIFARLNPKVAYVQGMNQILAPIFYLLNYNQNKRAPIQQATCFFMFNNVMTDILEMHIKDYAKKDNPVYSRMKHISTLLLALEPAIWKKLDELKIEPFVYCFRWITLLFSQEFEMFQTLRIWETIFSYDDRKGFTNFLALSLLLSSKQAIVNGDYSQIMFHLKTINQKVRVDEIIEKASSLYKKYGKADLSEMADKNLKKFNQCPHGRFMRFFKKIF